MKVMQRCSLSAVIAISLSAAAVAQTPAARPGAAPHLVLWVTTTAWPDGGEVPMRNAARGENKSPTFEFHWNLRINPSTAPDSLQTYVVIFHDVENSSNKTTTDTLHWTAFNIPGTAKALPEGLGSGDLPDGTRNGPGIASRGGKTPAYFGPGAGPGPIHHYVFEFYSLDTKLDLPADPTREDARAARDMCNACSTERAPSAGVKLYFSSGNVFGYLDRVLADGVEPRRKLLGSVDVLHTS